MKILCNLVNVRQTFSVRVCVGTKQVAQKVALFQGIVCYFGELLDLTSC